MTAQITDEWDDLLGRYTNYDTFDPNLNQALFTRQHTDLRSFDATDIVIPHTVYSLVLDMSELDTVAMSYMEGGTLYQQGERWTADVPVTTTYGPDPGIGGRYSLRVSLTAGQTVNITSTANPVDLTAYGEDDEFNIALPFYPGSSLSLAQITVTQGTSDYTYRFPSAPDGDFGVSFPVSDLGTIKHPDKITFQFTATAACTVRVAAIRALTSGWTDTKLDIQTIQQRLVPTVTRSGNVPTTPFPRIWRTDPSGDPLPINARLAVNFFSGEGIVSNSISLYMRQRREDFLTQLDINNESQDALTERNRQPDYGQAVYNPHPQHDLDTQKQSDLDTDPQRHLERVADLISESYIYVNLTWGPINRVIIGTTENTEAYTFNVDPLAAQEQHLFSVDLEDNAIRVRLNILNEEGSIGSTVFDSTNIVNDFVFPRRKGRVGWSFDINSGDVWIESVRSRGLMFGEVITNSFESMTPVEGAQIVAGATPNLELSTSLVLSGAATMDLDLNNARSADGSLRITASAPNGVQTPWVVFDDFDNAEVIFDVYYPSDALLRGQTLLGALVNRRGHRIDLLLPPITSTGWQRVRVPLSRASDEQTGAYRFALTQNFGTATWWIDNLSISQRSVAWAGRATYDDPWDRFNNRWINFGSFVNREGDGVIFPARGRWLQVRGQTLTPTATISKVYIKPKYAELGRLTWDVDRRYRLSDAEGI